MNIMTFEPAKVLVIEPVFHPPCERIYPCQAEEFELSRIQVQGASAYASSVSRGVEILFCTQGEVTVVETESLGRSSLSKGESILVPASHPGYCLQGQATLFKASGPRA
jgi:mannose-6-phosphate isomerase class I